MSENANTGATASKNKVDAHTAEQEFNRFAVAWEIDNNLDGMSNEDRAGFDTQKSRIVRAIMSGHLSVDESGDELTYKLKKGDRFDNLGELKFEMPSGDAYTAMDQHKEHHYNTKINAFLARMTKQSPKTFANMHALDRKVCEAIAALFLGS